jgi:hypothetical protein
MVRSAAMWREVWPTVTRMKQEAYAVHDWRRCLRIQAQCSTGKVLHIKAETDWLLDPDSNVPSGQVSGNGIGAGQPGTAQACCQHDLRRAHADCCCLQRDGLALHLRVYCDERLRSRHHLWNAVQFRGWQPHQRPAGFMRFGISRGGQGYVTSSKLCCARKPRTRRLKNATC